MNKLIYKIAVLFTAVSLVSCEKGLMTFDNENADVYFAGAGKLGSTQAFDSTYVSFGYVKVPDSLVNIIVSVTGTPEPFDREYKVSIGQLSEAELLPFDHDNNPATPAVTVSAAIAGTHFEALPEKVVIKKNTQADTIKLKLFRTPEMQNQIFLLTLNLLDNENFGTDFKGRKVSGKVIKTTSTKFRIDDMIKRPYLWSVPSSYFGVFSREKLFFMCDETGLTPQFFDSSVNPPAPAELGTIGKMVQRALDVLALEGKRVYEADGRVMSMGTSSGGTGK